jgi:hypothetical protein
MAKIEEQKTLLADVRALTDDALKLYNSGVKIPGVVQHLRAAGSELENRVRFLEREGRRSPRRQPKPQQPKPPQNQSKTENQPPADKQPPAENQPPA